MFAAEIVEKDQQVQTVHELKTDWSFFSNCIRPVCHSTLRFFLWKAVYIESLPKKVHTFCLRVNTRNFILLLQGILE